MQGYRAMTPERWQQIKQIFQTALECEPSRQAAYLAEACAGDPSLLSEVKSLLASHQQAENFIETPAVNGKMELLSDESIDPVAGKRIGAYLVIGEIGHGGMGTVYLAARDDDQFKRQVAIKLVSRGMDTDIILRRFRNERQILANLDHPNIARLFDGGTTEDGLPYFVMEHIVGEPIDDYCDLRKLPTVERLKLFRAVCSAVQYAHQKLIVHRDIKPGNILITGEGIPKLLDFGIAKILDPEFPSQTMDLTLNAPRPMTPEYASPEQVRRETVGTASDVYSLGVLLYQLLSGHRPYRFKSRQPQAMAEVICQQEPEKPSTAVSRVEHVEGTGGTDPITLTPESVSRVRDGEPDKLRRHLTGDLDNIVLKAIHKEPQRRYASVEEFSDDIHRHLEGLPVMARKDSLGYRHGKYVKRHKAGMAAALITLLLLTGIWVLIRTERGTAFKSMLARLLNLQSDRETELQGKRPSSSVERRRSVALLGFRNLSEKSEAAWLSTALSEMLTTELVAGEKLRAIPGENVARVKLELLLADTHGFSKETLSRVRTNLGTDLVVSGSYIALGKKANGQIRLDLLLQDTVVGETIATIAETGTEAELLNLVSRTGARLRDRLGVGEVSSADAVVARASLPSSAEVARFYAEGLAKLRIFDADAARKLFEHATAADPRFAPAHSALAAAWSSLGFDGKATEEAKKALDLSTHLSREERLSVEGRYREMTKEWEKAVEIYKSLFNFFPDNLEYGLRLATAQTSAAKGKDALITAEALRKLPPPTPNDPRIELAEASASGELADFKRMQAAAAKAAEKGATQGAKLLVARARLSEAFALRNLGKPKESMSASSEAQQIYTVAGDKGGVARALNDTAQVVWEQGDLSGAEKIYRQALATSREIGDKKNMASALNNLGVVLYHQGDLAGSKPVFLEALAIRREIGDKRAVGATLSNLAGVLRNQVDLAGAGTMLEGALQVFREIGDKRGVAGTLDNIGIVLVDQGRLGEAKRGYEESLVISGEIGNKRLSAYASYLLGEVHLAEGNLSEARKRHEEALAIRTELGEKETAAESRLALASLSVEEENFAQAQALAQEAADELQRDKTTDNEALAWAVLARSLLAQGKGALAQKEMNHASTVSLKSEYVGTRLLVAIDAARVHAALGKPTETAAVIKSLQAILAQAIKTGLVGIQLDARLVLGEIEIKAGNSAAGRARLKALQEEAKAKGYGLIARKALGFRI